MVSQPAQQFASGLAELLKEYAEKMALRLGELRSAREKWRDLKSPPRSSADWLAMSDEVGHLESALLRLTREASQLAEQGAVEDLTKFELRVRLAEVEGQLSAFRTLLNQPI
jgi:hypothetical protein